MTRICFGLKKSKFPAHYLLIICSLSPLFFLCRKTFSNWKLAIGQEEQSKMFSPVGTVDPNLQCAICLDAWCNPTELVPCEHIFCTACVYNLAACPLCRARVNARRRPHHVLWNMSREVRVKCTACLWEGTRETSEHHKCPKSKDIGDDDDDDDRSFSQQEQGESATTSGGGSTRSIKLPGGAAPPAHYCPQLHQLALVESLPAGYAPGSWLCDRCRRPVADSSKGVGHCSVCKFDLCPQCLPHGPMRCPQNHVMSTISEKPAHYPGWGCDRCKKSIPRGTRLVGHCFDCSYDLCPACCAEVNQPSMPSPRSL